MIVARSDQSLLARWWWTVDRWQLLIIAALMGFGCLVMLAASPAANADASMREAFQFAFRQLVYLPFAVAVMLAVSLLEPKSVRRIAVIGLLVSLILLGVTLLESASIKGASRWLSLGGLSLQPVEPLKPCFAVFAAWLLSAWRLDPRVPGAHLVLLIWAIAVALLLLQPDVGQAILISAVLAVQFFLAGLSYLWVGLAIGCGIAFLAAVYFIFPHAAARIDSFLDPDTLHYQERKAQEAFQNGGLFGQGPGEGRIKEHLPDAHADFVFAVAGEEFGLIACFLLVILFAVLVLRAFAKVLHERSLFSMLAVAGLMTQLGLQAFINMASTLSLIPTKGMTLPFISYGGSSYLALALGLGMALALTRKRPWTEAGE